MCGARPLYLAVGFILEEGLALADLERIVSSLAQAARAAQVAVVTGDTKVVDRGKGDGVYLNTSGVGLVPPGIAIGPERVRPGDVLLINGEIAAHGIAIMSVREGLEFETELVSDSAALASLVGQLLECGGEQIHCLRDPTRGGVASACCELAQAAGLGIRLCERSIPVADPVRGACELLGLDPLYVANEGKVIAVVAPEIAEQALQTMRRHPLGAGAAIIGEVTEKHPNLVVLRSSIGATRTVDLLSGEQLPRIC
jgi:hydrogenase expression/formation protein HypE